MKIDPLQNCLRAQFSTNTIKNRNFSHSVESILLEQGITLEYILYIYKI